MKILAKGLLLEHMNIERINTTDMGATTSRVFAGEYKSKTTKEMYGETADFFATEIRKRLPNNKSYSLIDTGSYQGELLGELLKKLPEYHLQTFGIDINQAALSHNSADQKILASAEALPLEDKSVDVAIVRYVLQWNELEKQRKILQELARVTREFTLIEHAGSDIINPEAWRKHTDNLFDGAIIPKMKREGYHFSSRDEIEKWMHESGITFTRLRDRRIENMANVYIERYRLNKEEAEKAKQILGDKNYCRQTDWIIFPLEQKTAL